MPSFPFKRSQRPRRSAGMRWIVLCCFASTLIYWEDEIGLTTMTHTGFRDTLATVIQDGQAELLSCKYEHFLFLDVDG